MIPATVLIPTSPIPAHPDTGTMDETIQSVRDRLGDVDILILADGVAAAIEHRTGDYHEYLRRLTWNSAHHWGRATPIIHTEHVHQAQMTRAALDDVHTPLVLFVEHDTPLVGDVDWAGCAAAIAADEVRVIRLYHETVMQPEHAALLVGDTRRCVDGVPLWPTTQWSSRPHVASTAIYRRLMNGPWWRPTDGMTEDRLHSVIADAGERYWHRWRLAIYYPDGNLQRSTHLDGRGDDPKVTWLDG